MEEIKSVVLVGAGNVATHLGRALVDAGYLLKQVYSRTESSASTLGRVLGCSYTASVCEVVADADLYIVSVCDDALPDVLSWVSQLNPLALFVHTAGSIDMNVWDGRVSRYGVLYPMQTFSKQREVDFSTVSFFIEALLPDDLLLLRTLGTRLGGKVYEATSGQRRYLHISAVFACNFVNRMYAIADQILTDHQLPFEALLPLIDETARKVHQLPPLQAQTGPAVRRDKAVMDSHLAMLASTPELAELYRLISQSIQAE